MVLGQWLRKLVLIISRSCIFDCFSWDMSEFFIFLKRKKKKTVPYFLVPNTRNLEPKLKVKRGGESYYTQRFSEIFSTLKKQKKNPFI